MLPFWHIDKGRMQIIKRYIFKSDLHHSMLFSKLKYLHLLACYYVSYICIHRYIIYKYYLYYVNIYIYIHINIHIYIYIYIYICIYIYYIHIYIMYIYIIYTYIYNIHIYNMIESLQSARLVEHNIIGEMKSQFFIGILLWVSCHCIHPSYIHIYIYIYIYIYMYIYMLCVIYRCIYIRSDCIIIYIFIYMLNVYIYICDMYE